MSLSREEEAKAFNEITASLSLDEKFTNQVVRTDRKFSGQRSMTLAVVSVAIGVAVLLTGLYVTTGILEIAIGAVGFIIMIIGAYLFFPAQGEATMTGSKPKSTYMMNLEKKWDERKQREGQA